MVARISDLPALPRALVALDEFELRGEVENNNYKVDIQLILDLVATQGYGDLLSTNNLSDVADAATARANIGAGIGDMLSTNNLSEVTSQATARANIGAIDAAGPWHDGFSDYVAEEHLRWDLPGAEQIDPSRYDVTGTGEANTASNQGAGVGVFDGKVAEDLEFRSLVALAGITIALDGPNKEVDIGVDAGAIDHDTLGNIPANDHIDHSGVSITAGLGLTGGGDITTTRTLDVGAGNGISVLADSIAVNEAQVDHDALLNYSPTRHVDHAGVTIIAGDGLTGGGAITSTMTLNVGQGTGITVQNDSILVNNSEVDHNSLGNYSSNQHRPSGLGAYFDGGGSALTDGSYIEVVAPFTGTIDIGTLLADPSGSVTVTVESATYANWPTLGTLGTLTLSAAQKSQDSGISWAVTAGDIIRFTLSGVATITKLTVDLYFTKS